MNTTPNHALAEDIGAAVLAAPGVTTIFATGTTTSKILDAGAKLLGLREADTPLVHVERTSEHVSVEIAIGVAASVSAMNTVRHLHDLIERIAAQATGRPAEIRITVAHIDEKTPLARTQ